MINFRFITNIIGKLLFVESAFLILCIIVALIYGENDLMAFVYSAIITLGVGSLMTFTVKVKDRVLAKKDGYFIVTCTWIIFTIFGCLPYLFGGTIPSIVDKTSPSVFANPFISILPSFFIFTINTKSGNPTPGYRLWNLLIY